MSLIFTFSASPEFKLLLELTHPERLTNESKFISEIHIPSVAWSKFLDAVEWHRMTPQVYQQLKLLKGDIPEEYFSRLKCMNDHCRMTSLTMISWLARLSLRLGDQNIDFIVLKGAGLSQHLYSKSSYREVRDIDILVDEKNINAAERVLFASGFIRTTPYPGATPRQLRYFNKHKKDREYYHPDDGTIVELHWRLIEVDHPYNPVIHDLLSTEYSITLQGKSIPIPTVSPTNLWLYLSLHGSLAGWYRMRWINDIALLLYYDPPEDWATLFRLAEHHGCKQSVIEAVGLACSLYHLQVPAPIRLSIRHNKGIQKSILSSANQLFYKKSTCGNIITYSRRIFFCSPISSLLKHLIGRIFISTGDFEKFHLPDRFFFGYYLLRPFSFLYRRILSKQSHQKN